MTMRAFPGRRPARSAGFTLLEVMVASAILVILVSITIMCLIQSTNLYEEDTLATTLETTGRRVIEDMALELRQAGRSTLVPWAPANATNIAFKQDIGYVSGTGPTYGSLIIYRGEIDPTENNDGIDNNKNRLIDEFVVTRQVGAGNKVTIARYVKKNGLTFNWDAPSSTLVINLVMENIDSKGRLTTKKISTSVMLRNN